MRYLRILIVVVAAIMAAQAAQGRQFRIGGVVKSRGTNISLVDADVTLVSPAGNDTIRTKAHGFESIGTRGSYNIRETSVFIIDIPDVVPDSYELTVAYPDYDTLRTYVDLSDIGRREHHRNLGALYLDKAKPVKTLDEVTVTASKIKFYNKGDTIVYNADAFNLAEGSMLDELIRQFPGVELKDNGQIFVNGRFVESLMLNGKDFFKGDNLVLLENLGAFTVKDVQVYEKLTDQNRFLGREGGDKELVMDVNLKKEYIGGWTFNVQGGYGTENRYLGRFFGLNFDARRRFTLYANANNLNDKRTPGESDSWTPESRQEGLLRHIESGFDYHIDTDNSGNSYVTGNVKFQQDRTSLTTVNDRVGFYPTGNMSGRTLGARVNRGMSLKTGHKMMFENDRVQLRIEPSLNYRHSNSRYRSRALNLNVERPADEVAADMDKVFDGGLGAVDRDQVINATFEEAFSKSHTLDVSAIASGSIKIPKTSDAVNVFLQYSHRSDGSDGSEDYMIGYGDPATPSLMRRQRTDNSPNRSHSAIAEIGYNCMIDDNWSFDLYLDQRHDRNTKESSFYIAQAEADATGDFTLGHLETLREVLDPANSYNSTETSQRFQINPSLTFSKGKVFVYLEVPVARMIRRLDYNRGGEVYPVRDRRWILRKAKAQFSWRDRSKGNTYFLAIYTANHDLPGLTRMIDITDTTNPLLTYLGNRGLSTSLTHDIDLSFRISRNNRYSVWGGANARFISDGYIQSRLYDTSTGYTVYQWLNSPVGEYSLLQFLGSEFIFGPKERFTVSARLDMSQSRRSTMTGENTTAPTLYRMNNYFYRPHVGLGYTFGKSRLSLIGEVELRHSVSSRPGIDPVDSRDFKYGVQGVFSLPYGLGISTDFYVYQRRGYDSPQLNTDDLVWNMRLSKTFGKGRWTVAVDGFDLLHQLTSVRYSVGPSGRVETYTNTLPRYVLCHVQYKINIMPKKKELTSRTIDY